MVTIDNMTVQFDVEGDDDDVFARKFRVHIERWARAERERQRAEEQRGRDRAIGRARRAGGEEDR